MGLSKGDAGVLKGVEGPYLAAVGRLFQPPEQGGIHAFPAQALGLREHRVPHGLRVPALAAGSQEGAAGVGLVPAAEVFVDESLPVEPGVQGTGGTGQHLGYQLADELLPQVLLSVGSGVGFEAQLEDGGGDLHPQLPQGLVGGLGLVLAVVPGDGGTALGGQNLPGQGGHPFRIHVTGHAQHHVGGVVKGFVAGVEGVGGDVGDGLPAARHRYPDRIVCIEGGEQVGEHLPLRVVLDHLDLLADDALLLVHALRGEPGDGDKGEEDAQVLLEFLGALEVIAGNGRAGEGIGGSAVGGQVLKGVTVLGVKHLVFQEVGYAGGSVLPYAVQLKAHVHAAVVGGEEGVALLKAGLHIHVDGKAVVQTGGPDGLAHP